MVAPLPLLDGNDLQQLFRLDPGKKIGNLLEALTEATRFSRLGDGFLTGAVIFLMG